MSIFSAMMMMIGTAPLVLWVTHLCLDFVADETKSALHKNWEELIEGAESTLCFFRWSLQKTFLKRQGTSLLRQEGNHREKGKELWLAVKLWLAAKVVNLFENLSDRTNKTKGNQDWEGWTIGSTVKLFRACFEPGMSAFKVKGSSFLAGKESPAKNHTTKNDNGISTFSRERTLDDIINSLYENRGQKG